MCANTAKAYRGGHWLNAVRNKRNGTVLEPFSGTFDVTVAPGEDVQAAVDRCPRGGCVLLQPGTHEGPLVLRAGQEVHVFGRGQATLRTTAGTVLTCEGASATVDGISLKRVLEAGQEEHGVAIWGGALRLQTCDIISVAGAGIWGKLVEEGARYDLSVVGCKCAQGGGGIAPFVGGTPFRDFWAYAAPIAGCACMTGHERAFATEGLPGLLGCLLPHALTSGCLCPRPLSPSIFDNGACGAFIMGPGAHARLEDCDFARSGADNVSIHDGASVLVKACRIHGGGAGGHGCGVDVSGSRTVCRIEGCEIWRNSDGGIFVSRAGDPLLIGNTIRDHARGNDDDVLMASSGIGLFVIGDSVGLATVRPDNVFARNEGGDVVRH